MSTRLLIDLQGRTLHDITRVILASEDRQAQQDWRKRLLNCVAEMERGAKPKPARELKGVQILARQLAQTGAAAVSTADAPDVTPKSVL